MRSLRTISVACWLSLLVTGAVLAASYYDLHDYWPKKDLAWWWAALLLWALPFLVILELARRRRTETLALALGFGVTGVGAVLYLFFYLPKWFVTDTEYPYSFTMFLPGLLVSAVLQGIMAVSALRSWWKSRPLRPVPRFPLPLVFCGGVLAGLVLPPLVLSTGTRRGARGWPLPVNSMRAINTAEFVYASTYGRGYSPTLAALGPPPGSEKPSAAHAGLIDEVSARGQCPWCQYTLTYTSGPKDAAGRIGCYALSARPLEYLGTATKSYFTDESEVIRFTTEDRPATAKDAPFPG